MSITQQYYLDTYRAQRLGEPGHGRIRRSLGRLLHLPPRATR